MKFRSIVVLTGAGISAESGLKTFRGSDGLWEGHRVEDVATPEAFERNPALVHQFYNQRRHQLLHGGVSPNKAHHALAEFEKNFKGEFLLVTQNIDNLHEQAGSKNLLHMHGELLKARCLETGKICEIKEDLSVEGSLRPHIVWFGETPMYMEEIYKALNRCDLFVSIGTSGNVYPAAGFVRATPRNAKRVEINMEDTMISDAFEDFYYGPASLKVPEFFSSISQN